MPLPNFLILGAAKSATTSLHQYLRAHPAVFMPAQKEPHFFAVEGHPLDFTGPGDHWLRDAAVTTLDAYHALFAEAGDATARGEASPLYLYHPEAPARIHHHVPDARLIVSLRHPVERAHSHYWHMVRHGREPLADFAAALAAAPERHADGWEWYWQYLDFGHYHAQLSRYLALFPRARLHVVFHEDLAANPGAVVAELFRFLGVDPAFRPPLLQHNASGAPRSRLLHQMLTRPNPVRRAVRAVLPLNARKQWFTRVWSRNVRKPPLDPALRARLLEHYRDDIGRLETLLGRDLGHWLV